MGILGWLVYLATLDEDASEVEGDRNIVIVASVFVAVEQFSPLRTPNSQFQLRSGTRK